MVIEQRARDAGIMLLTTEDKIKQVELDFQELRDARVQQQQLLQELQKVEVIFLICKCYISFV